MGKAVHLNIASMAHVVRGQ